MPSSASIPPPPPGSPHFPYTTLFRSLINSECWPNTTTRFCPASWNNCWMVRSCSCVSLNCCRSDSARCRLSSSSRCPAWWNSLLASTDRKSTRLNSSHVSISYAVFCFHPTSTARLSPLSLHDALPIFDQLGVLAEHHHQVLPRLVEQLLDGPQLLLRLLELLPQRLRALPALLQQPLPGLVELLAGIDRSEEHTSELQSRFDLVCRLLLPSHLHRPALPTFPTRRSSDL